MRFQVLFTLAVVAAALCDGAAEAQRWQQTAATPGPGIELEVGIPAQHRAAPDEDAAFAEFEAAVHRLLDHPGCSECIEDYNSALARYQAALFAAQRKIVDHRCDARPALCGASPQKDE